MNIRRYKLNTKERAAILDIIGPLGELKLDQMFPAAAGIATRHFTSCSKYWLGQKAQFSNIADLKCLGEWLGRSTSESLVILEGLPVTVDNAAAISLFFSSEIGHLVEFHGHGKPVIAVSDKGKIVEGRPSSDNNLTFPLHTDLSFNEKMPEIVCYTIVDQGSSGGESLYCEGESLIHQLSPSILDALQRPFRFPAPPHQPNQVPLDAPILTWDENAKPLIRYREDGLEALGRCEKRYGQNMALLAFKLCMQQNIQVIPLNAGAMAIWDNRRWLHGRNSFEDSEGRKRLAARAYAELSKLPTARYS